MKEMKRILSLILCMVMLIGVVPVNAFAFEDAIVMDEIVVMDEIIAEEPVAEEPVAEESPVPEPVVIDEIEEISETPAAATGDDTLAASLAKAKAYTDAITINNSSNDPATVVANYGTHFTWDNEKRESGKSYLYDWSYYNGVVFEGLEYLYEVTENIAYKDYVVEYMSSLITSNGTWAKCSNNTSKECAGYNSTHGADCYKTASLLLDAYEMTNDSRYLTIAETLYADLDTAAKSYSLANAGNNYRHTWASDSTPDLWLDGLYMILPFRAEYAKHIGDTEELDLIVSRMKWVSDNMYNSAKGLFYHAADSATSNSGTYWLRSIGWYAAAIVDIMDSMEGDNLTAMQAQLKKLVDGMKACQNTSNGMWLNNMAASQSTSNPYETSGTALVCYAVMKAVNNGWLDKSYADMAILAFNGICNEKLNNNNLTDICFKGAPGSSNSTFYDNEGKGVGPFIMFYAEVQEYVNDQAEEPSEPVENTVTVTPGNDTITATGVGLTGITVELDETTDFTGVFEEASYAAYDIDLAGYTEGDTVKLTMSLDSISDENLVVYKVAEDGTRTEITLYEAKLEDGILNITFSISSTGTYACGTKATVIPDGAILSEIKVTKQPDQLKYFREEANPEGILPLDITGLEVTATFTNGMDTVEKVIYWNEFGEKEGYSLSVDMTKLGQQNVEISYTYGEGSTKTTSYSITIYERRFEADAGEAKIAVDLTVPGVTDMVVTENAEAEFVVSALSGLLENYISYDITLAGYIDNEKVTVTMPVPAGEGVAVVYHIPESGAAEKLTDVTDNGNGTVTFTTTHFSTYAAGRAADAVSGTGNLVGGKVYTLDTDGVTANKNYLIVNTNTGTGYALTNNIGTAARTQVTISNSTITVEDDTNIAWQFSGTTSGTVGNNGRYVYPGNGSLSLNNSDTNLTISNQNNGAYRIYRSGRNNTYYVRYNNNAWTGSTSSGNVYLYEYTSPSSGEAVTFTVTPGSATLKPGDKTTLTGTVEVAGETVDLSDCTITWASSDTSKATVSSGTVTGVADGTANITATLSAVNGTSLQENIVLTIPVTVQSKKVTNTELLSESGTVYAGSSTGANTHAQIQITYSDGTTELVNVTVDMLSGGDKTLEEMLETIGDYGNLTVTYDDKVLSSNFTLHVIEAPNLDEPEYPNEGSVSVNKVAGDVSQFQNIGVAEVQLSTSGIPIRTGVNALLIMDISNSMSWDDSAYDYTDRVVTDATQRLNISRESAKTFASELLAPYSDGTPTDNTLTILNFAGIDAEYNEHDTAPQNDDVYQIGKLAMTTVAEAEAALDTMVKATTGGTNYDYAFQQAYALSEQLYEKNGQPVYIVFMTDGVPTHYNGVYYKSRSSTDLTAMMNYVDPATGEVSRYTSTGNDRNGNNIDFTATMQNVTLYFYDGTTATRNLTYNKGWSDYVTNNKNAWAEKVKTLEYVEAVYAIGFGMANGSVTQGAVNSNGTPAAMPTPTNTGGGQYYIPSSVTHATLRHMASSPEMHFEADDLDAMNALYATLASQIRQAATNAYFVDQTGSSFDLQRTSSVTKFTDTGSEVTYAVDPLPVIKVSAYKIYKAEEVGSTINGVTVTESMVGIRYGTPTVLESVAFSADGKAAYSSSDGYTKVDTGETDNSDPAKPIYTHTGSKNILIDGVICAYNFWYNTTKETKTITLADGTTYDLPAETFYWNIGTIGDQEFVLSYYLYLTGSAEGQAPAGTYATNNYATLHYTNWLGNEVDKDVQSPSIAWKSAAVNYGFYLVDTSGNPVVNKATGQTGSFNDAVKVTPKIFYDEILLNSIDSVNTTIQVVSTKVPDGYKVFDNGARYTIAIDSAQKVSGWTITNTVAPDTTYVTDYKDTEYTKIENASATDYADWDFTSTTVWFAVVWEPSTVPDVVVIDYGLPVDISVLANDLFGDRGTLNGIGAVEDKPETVTKANIYTKTPSTSFEVPEGGYQGTYGKATIENGEVRYTPRNMQMNGYDKFAYEVQYLAANGELQYYYGDVTVIPATTIYYEDSFVKFHSEKWQNNGWVDYTTEEEKANSLWSYAENGQKPQDEDRPGEFSLTDANNIYGYDSANLAMSTYSLNGYAKATVDYDNSAVAEFDFYGTGFDVISMTNNTTGTIYVSAFKYGNDGTLATEPTFKYAVDTYYGYKPAYYQVKYTYVGGQWTVANEGDKETITEEAYLTGTKATAPAEPKENDTYTTYEVEWTPVNPADNDASASIYQVPVMTISDLDYGKYKAQIRVIYDPLFDHNTTDASNSSTTIDTGYGDYDFYLDAIRIYDPANDGASDGGDDTVIEDAYIADHEGWPDYIELRNKIINEESFDDVAGDALKPKEGVVFIDGDAVVGDAQMADYKSYGPNNEIYLNAGQRIAFKLNLNAYVGVDKKPTVTVDGKTLPIVDKIHIGLKSADGKPASYTFTNISEDGSYYNASTNTISTTTDMYYDLTSWANGDVIVISNYTTDSNTSGILSITNIKVTFRAEPGNPGEGEKAAPDTDAGTNPDTDVEKASFLYMTPAATTMTLRTLNSMAQEEPVPEETVPEETVPETTEPEETESEETKPGKPNKPEKPSKPSKPSKPAKPNKPGNQNQTNKPNPQEIVETIRNVLEALLSGWFK